MLKLSFTSNKPQKENVPTPSSTNPGTAPLDLTLGIEIECLLLRDTRNVDPTNLTGRQRIHACLSEPLKANCSTCGVKHDFGLPLNAVVLDRQAQQEIDTDYKKWTVDEDPSLGLTPEEARVLGRDTFVGFDRIEIKSRVLSTSQPLITNAGLHTHTHSVNWDAEIRAVYEHLQDTFNKAPGIPGIRLMVNPSTGTHVHIGQNHHGFPLDTVKNVLSMYVANERAIDSMHAADRIGGSTLAFSKKPTHWLTGNYTDKCLDDGVFNLPWSAHFQTLAFKISSGHGNLESEFPANAFNLYSSLKGDAQQNDVRSWLKVIRFASNIKDLQNLQNGMGHNSTVNLDNLLDFSAEGTNRGTGSKKRKMTIEFRQHGATLRAAEVIAWINVLLKLLTYCHSRSVKDVKDLCERTWSDPSHNAFKFLTTLGVNPATQRHYTDFLKPNDGYAESYLYHREDMMWRFGFDFFRPLCQHNLLNHADMLRSGLKENQMKKKLICGGYGQFEAKYVSQLDVTAEERTKLTIGWRPDRSGRVDSPVEPAE
ncbi:hypothetical protein PRZ48_011632 [Zasmidium cellare]|uniref:Uncharacterized protein n=1 Tax=Zasmidium cellare TaxID=395010 RepID=A0ABR0E6X4_ZASCE|nr:hypothetical protein PRZ48_011632 [Zasmidium cellare]